MYVQQMVTVERLLISHALISVKNNPLIYKHTFSGMFFLVMFNSPKIALRGRGGGEFLEVQIILNC